MGSKNADAGPSNLSLQKRYPPAVPSSPRCIEDDVESGGPKRKKKVRRGTRAGRMVKEMARIRAESSARASQSEAEASSSAPEIQATPSLANSSAPEIPAAPSLLTADEIEAEVEDGELVAPVDEDEEMLEARWSYDDDEDRPVAGP
ncbi:hypothetical protein B0H13DRAFT_2389289 [Mycena leptocephala]|nr:hypothetical protein B0H13DRAFT_2389289 [Mycena leptocephala]